MKKFLTYVVVIATMVWSLGIASIVPAFAATVSAAAIVAYPTAHAGDLIKVPTDRSLPGTTGVYIIGSDLKKYLFSTENTFFTWFSGTWAQNPVTVISQTDFDAISLGGHVIVRPGVSLMRFDNSPKVYAVTPTGITSVSDAVAKALYGASYATGVITIQTAFETDYTKLADWTSTTNLPDGSLIKFAGDTTGGVYYIAGGAKQLVSGDAWTASKFKASATITVPATAVYPVGPAFVASFNVVTPGVGPVVSGTVNVALAADTPAPGTVIAGQAVADFAHFTFTGTGTVTSLRVKRIGVSSDDRLRNVYLYDGNTKLTDAGYMSNGYVTFSNPAGLFTVSGSKTISVKADLDNTNVSQSIGLAINAASDISGVNVTGSFPINGNVQSFAYASDLATAVFTLTYPTADQNIDANTVNQSFWAASLQISQRATALKYVSFKQIGSISPSDLQNLGLYVAGTKVASGSINASNNLVFDMTNSPVALATGARTIEVRGDVVSGSNKTFSLNIQTASDVILMDTNYGVNISATVPANSYTFTIGSASVVLSADSSFTATQIVGNATNATLDQFTIQAYGETAKIYSVTTTIALGNATAGDRINNVALFLDGSQLGSAQTASTTGGSVVLTFGSGNLVTLPADGKAHKLEVRGDLSLVGTSTETTVGVSALTLGTVQGMTSYKTVAAGTITNNGNPNLTIVSGALTNSKNPNVYDYVVAPNTAKVLVGSYILSASNADDVTVTNLTANLNNSAVATGRYLTNLYVAYDAYTSAPIGNPSASVNNFSVNFVLAKNTSKTVNVYADISSPATNGASSTVTLGGTATGSSGATVIFPSTTGQTVTVTNGALYTTGISKTSNSLSAQYVLGASTINLMVLNFVATTTPITIDEMGFTFGGTAVIASMAPITAISVNGISKNVNDITTSTVLTGLNLLIPAGFSGTDVPVAVTYSQVGLGALDAGYTVTSTLVYVKYHVGNQTQLLYPTVASNGFLLVSTKPSLALTKPSTTLSDGTDYVARIAVTADKMGKVVLKDLPLKITATNAVFNTTTDALIIKVDGSAISTQNAAFSATGTTTLKFSASSAYTNYSVAAYSTVYLDLYVQGVVLSGSAASDSHITTQLGAQSLFVWTDVGGNNKDVTGLYYNNWSSDTITVTD